MSTRKKAPVQEPASMEKIKTLSHDLLLAGIGAWVHSRSRKEADAGTGRRAAREDGMPDFATLVSEGRKAEPELKASMQKAWEEWKEKTQSLSSTNRFAAGGDRLRGAFDERVGSAISSLGLPTRKELDALQAKVDRLLAATKAPAKRVAAKKAGAKKAASKSRSAADAVPAKKATQAPAAKSASGRVRRSAK